MTNHPVTISQTDDGKWLAWAGTSPCLCFEEESEDAAKERTYQALSFYNEARGAGLTPHFEYGDPPNLITLP